MSITLQYPQTMSINGVTIENAITGYTTLEVKGREPWDQDVTTIRLSTQDGERYRRKRMNSRQLTVRFALEADTPEHNMALYEQLNGLLSFEEAQIVFADEPGKYYVGTAAKVTMEYINAAVSTGIITIFCSDPFKYSLTEKTVTPVAGNDGAEADILYEGTRQAYPVVDITMTSHLGFVGIDDGNGHTIQIGDPTEADQEAELPGDESIITVISEPPTDWEINNGFRIAAGTSTKTVMGNVQEATVQDLGKRWATPTYGTQASGWHGPTLSYPIDNGGAVNITFSWNMLFYDSTSAKSQIGIFVAEMQDGNGQNVAAITVMHNVSGDAKSYFEFFLNGNSVRSGYFRATQDNTVTGEQGGFCYMEKSGATVVFKFGANTYSYTDEALENVAVTECGFFFGRRGADATLARNRLSKASIIAHQSVTPGVVPNAFQSGDVVTVDTASASIYLNGALSENLGAFDNDWEGFTIKPGTNTITFVCSSWAHSVPIYSVRYREVFV